MQHISTIFEQSLEVNKSTFHSFLLPYGQFKQTLNNLKQKHPKANHIVWAYRYINDYNQIVENSSDDGEPKGCAANPTLAQLRGFKLIQSAIITVRYFGGIKLGTGGMVRAYSEAAKKVILHSALIPFIKQEPFTLKTPYPLIQRYEHFFKKENVDFSNREFCATWVIWNLNLSIDEKNKLNEFESSL